VRIRVTCGQSRETFTISGEHLQFDHPTVCKALERVAGAGAASGEQAQRPKITTVNHTRCDWSSVFILTS